jgi:hypothetical protein
MSRFSDDVHDLAGEAKPVISIPVTREDMTNSGTIDCSLPENQNNPGCNITEAVFDSLLLVIIIGIIIYAVIIFAAVKTKNQNLKIFLIVSMFLPFLAPAGLIIALLIITNAI